MRKFLSMALFFVLYALLFTPCSAQETLTITTYYPSPYGSYNELRSERMAIGYMNRSEVCWDPPCTGGGTDISDNASRNIDLIVEGSVGIGTTAPKDALHVGQGRVIVGDIGSFPPSTFDTGLDPNTLILSGNNRDVAIVSMGTTDSAKADLEFWRARGTPSSPLDVLSTTQLGWLQWRGYYGGSFRERIASIGAIMDGIPGVNDYPTRLEFWTTPDNSAIPQSRMVIKNDGNVGIGRIPTANKLEVEGDASKTAVGDWLANSDIRIKADISGIENALEVINRLRPVKFRYTDEYKAKHPSMKDVYYYNFIAQEFQEVFADSVKDDGEGYLQMDTHNVRPYLVAAVQELSKAVKAQQQEIQALKQEVIGIKPFRH